MSSDEDQEIKVATKQITKHQTQNNQTSSYLLYPSNLQDTQNSDDQTLKIKQNKQQVDFSNSSSNHKKYGHMKVIYEGFCFLAFGPDYWCFIPSFTCFSIVSYFILLLVFRSTSNFVVRVGSLIICLGHSLSYFLVAISNPGIITSSNYSQVKNVRTKLCRKCKIIVPINTVHCQYCDVCIEQYDHHCPWVSKCVGKGNIVQFYIFICLTPIFFLFCMVAFVMCMGSELNSVNRHNIKNNHPNFHK